MSDASCRGGDFNRRSHSNGGFMPYNDPKSRPPSPTRRKFLLTSGTGVAAGLVAAYVPAPSHSAAGVGASGPGSAATKIEGAVPITLRINGKDHKLQIDP